MAESSKREYWGQKPLHFKKELNLLRWWKKDAEQKINEELKRLKDSQEEGAEEQLTSRYKSIVMRCHVWMVVIIVLKQMIFIKRWNIYKVI